MFKQLQKRDDDGWVVCVLWPNNFKNQWSLIPENIEKQDQNKHNHNHKLSFNIKWNNYLYTSISYLVITYLSMFSKIIQLFNIFYLYNLKNQTAGCVCDLLLLLIE